MPEYTREQLEQVYEKLPDELQEAIFSFEAAKSIGDISQRYGIEDERVGEIADMAGLVLMGLMLPEELERELTQKLKLEKEVAKNIAHELTRFVFFPVKGALAQLHQVSAPTPTQGVYPERAERVEGPSKPAKEDVYLEPVEGEE